MKIGVLSDTHIDDLSSGLEFMDHLCAGPFAEVDVILHAGDIVHPDLLHCFTGRPIIGVRGNCDAAAPDLPVKRICTFAGFRIGLIHGWGGSGDLLEYVVDSFADESLDVLVFGHSHTPLCRLDGSLLLLNPGSATDRREAPFHSVAILTLAEQPYGRIVNLEASGQMVATFTGDLL